MILQIKLQILKTNKKFIRIILINKTHNRLKAILGYIHRLPKKHVKKGLGLNIETVTTVEDLKIFLNLNLIEKWLAVGAIPTAAVLKIFKDSCYF